MIITLVFSTVIMGGAAPTMHALTALLASLTS